MSEPEIELEYYTRLKSIDYLELNDAILRDLAKQMSKINLYLTRKELNKSYDIGFKHGIKSYYATN